MKTNYRRVYLKRDEDKIVEAISSDELRALLRREVIQNEINSNKVNIDRECFKHTFVEKKNLKEAKTSDKKLNDTIEFEKESRKLIDQMSKSTSFDCGGKSRIIYLHQLN